MIVASCSSKNDVAINENHDGMLETHAYAASDAVVGQANAIALASRFECTERMSVAECALGKVAVAAVAAKEIASIKFQEFMGQRPKTGVDVQIATGNTIGKGIPVLTMGVVAYKSIAEDSGTVNNSADNGATINNSLEENHATAIANRAEATANNYPNTSPAEPIVEEEDDGIPEGFVTPTCSEESRAAGRC